MRGRCRRKRFFRDESYAGLMANLNVAVLGAPDYARGIGKRSTASDITFYDVKEGDTTVSMAEPSKYPEKLASLFFVSSLADLALVVVDEIGPAFGETLLMLDCLGVKEGFLVLRNYITPEQIAPLIKDTVLAGYKSIPDEPLATRQRLLEIAALAGTGEPGPEMRGGSVAVDHYFDVKGVGTVVLGCVAEGVIRKHDSVRVLPSGKKAEVRSIQKHDDDFDWGVKGDRVGLALKGVTVEDLDRGTVLTTNEKVGTLPELHAKANLVKYWPRPLDDGTVLHIGHWMQFEPGRVEAAEAGGDWRNPRLKIAMTKEIVRIPGSKAVLTQLDGGKLRVAGTVDMI